MQHPQEYKDRQVVVLGLAKSGVAVAKLFRRFDAQVTVNDRKEREQCPEAGELEALGISVVCGGHPDALIHENVALVVKNPGIFYSIPPVRQAESMGIEVVTEVEVAYRVCRAPIIGITGSNGKTTTTTWIGSMLEAAGLHPIVAGNIGRPLCDAAQEAEPHNWMVVELSSFQLKGTSRFRPRIACLLNLYETHLDYHGTIDDYIASKAKLFANQTEDDTAVLNWDDPVCRSLAKNLAADILPFSLNGRPDHGVYLEGDTIVFKDKAGRSERICRAGELGVPGRHNVENALAAVAVALAAGADPGAIAKSLSEFRGVEHRLEFVRERNGVTFINGSKATNPSATIKDLEAFDRPVVLIAGGLDRGMEYTDLVPFIRGKVRSLVAIGETRDKLADMARQAGVQAIHTVEARQGESAAALEEAVRLAAADAAEGSVILLSPACASWDMFDSYEERGRIFKQAVHNL